MFAKFMAEFRENRRIAAFLGGQAVSLFGSSLVQYALMWSIMIGTNSGSQSALYIACMFLPQIFISLVGGVWADRHNRKMLIMLADGGIALATLVLAGIMLLKDLGYAPVFIIAAIRSFGGGVQSPAISAILPQIVPEEKLLRVNGINSTIQSVIMLLSPGGAVLAMKFLPLPGILMIDVATAALAIAILLPIRIPTHERTIQDQHILLDLRDGLHYAMNHFFIRRLTGYYVFSSILIVPIAMFTPLFVRRVYALPDVEFNMMLNEVVFFVGSLIGGGLMAWWGGFKNRLMTLAFGCALTGVAAALMGLAPAFWLYLAFMVLSGVSMPCFQAPVMSLMQEKIAAEVMGRVFGLMQIASTSIMMVASIAVGVMSDQAPLGMILTASGALLVVLGLVLALDRKFLPEGLPKPPAAPEAVSADGDAV
ncbi:MAG: MFS transporter [Clostridiales bacterium]|nr:MFS transporter [Clostridiales bacterium]